MSGPELRPSGAGVWCGGGCTAAPSVRNLYPDEPPNEITIEGSALHEVIRSESLNPGGDLRELVGTSVVVQDEKTGQMDEVFLTYELLALAKVALDNRLLDLKNLNGRPFEELIEEPVDISCIYPGYKGTPDRVVWVPETKTLYVDDYKFGYVEVSPKNNYQLISYVAGLINKYKFNPETLVFRIIQPRSREVQKVKTWICSRKELDTFHIPKLKRAAEEVMSTHPRRQASTHCRYCPGKLECQSYQDMGSALFQSFLLVSEDQREVDLPKMKEFAELGADFFKTLVKSVDQRMADVIVAGGGIQGWGMRSSRGGWNFKKELDKASLDKLRLLNKAFGVETMKTVPKTPTQLKNSGIDPSLFEEMTVRKPGSMKLAPVDFQQELEDIFG